MANLNKTLLIGRLTRDPELRTVGSAGTSVCEFGLAVNREWTSAAGDRQKEVLFIECTAWARRAEVMAQYLSKGSPVFVEGYLKLDEWEDRETGAKRSKIKFVVDNFQFLESRRDREGGGQQESRGGDRHERPQGDGPGPETPDDDFPLEDDVPF
jgi:single-strand DNA-binding protein